jgi:hypothetical protein
MPSRPHVTIALRILALRMEEMASRYGGTVKKKLLCFFFNQRPHHESVLESGSVAPRILNLGTRWRWMVSFTLRLLYPQGESRWYPLYRRVGQPQSWSERGPDMEDKYKYVKWSDAESR